jgi:hypothetical protein
MSRLVDCWCESPVENELKRDLLQLSQVWLSQGHATMLELCRLSIAQQSWF